jgi:phage tail sheath protein FI
MAIYKTPGVYVEEISTLPPSVAGVSTAIPAFIGYTEIGPTSREDAPIVPVVARINTMLEYRALFGAAYPSSFTAKTRAASGTNLGDLETLSRVTPIHEYLLYYAVSHYFQNGGGSCYIISIGNYSATPSKDQYQAGLDALEKEDEPTLILLTDAVNLLLATDYYALCQAALAQCKKLGDRFTILDIAPSLSSDAALKTTTVADFRTNIGTTDLSYGAAYYPFIQTTLNYEYTGTSVEIQSGSTTPTTSTTSTPSVTPTTSTTPSTSTTSTPSVTPATSTDTGGSSAATTTTTTTTITATTVKLEMIRSDNTALYNQIKSAIAQQRVVLPPSAAIAGIYASVDRDRGVWKAPANVSLSAVIGPVTKITSDDQEDLNVDPSAGKSINAIRAFSGKGTLVWGARTLAGNDNEWRYIPVRRLFIMIEESVQKATAFAVFEPNDATTWLKVKAMIESYLYGLWEQGALAGPTPEAAYFVQVGLGKTMTTQDVLEGRLIVEIGIAAVRPAEFILLKFTHKLQEA